MKPDRCIDDPKSVLDSEGAEEIIELADIGGSGTGNARYPYYYGPEGRLLLVDSALDAVGRGSTTI